MEVSDERCHAWDVVSTVGLGGSWCLWWWLQLGVLQEGESTEPGACYLSPSAYDNFSCGDKECYCCFVVYHNSALVTKGTNSHEVLAEVRHDVPFAKR